MSSYPSPNAHDENEFMVLSSALIKDIHDACRAGHIMEPFTAPQTISEKAMAINIGAAMRLNCSPRPTSTNRCQGIEIVFG